MRFFIQRVNHAKVLVEGKISGQIGTGLLVLIGVSEEDTREIADKMIKKLIGLRIFEDENQKTNLALNDVGGSLLLGFCFEVSKAQARPSDSIFPMLVDLNIELSFFLYHNVFTQATMLPSHDDNELNL